MGINLGIVGNLRKAFGMVLAVWVACTGVVGLGQSVKGFNLNEIGQHYYDADPSGAAKTEAQKRVDQLIELGVNHINLSPRAVMRDPRGNELIPLTPGADRPRERRGYINLMNYIHSRGLTVGVRPIFFVVDADGNTPSVETLPDGKEKIWWHGNIQPRSPNAWFDSFKEYLDIYLQIAKLGNADEFTVGAELYSMTVGIEDQWLEHPHGFPGRWADLILYAKAKLGLPGCRVMYDINFTDDVISAGGITESGGEFARWRYRLVDLFDPADKNWLDMQRLWVAMDAVGIDMYRSLAADNALIPADYDELVALLLTTSQRYATQIDNTLFDIEITMGFAKQAILKEIGYKSVDRGFIRPFEYTAPGAKLNVMHQAAGYDAIYSAFWNVGWLWFEGIVWWDASVDPRLHGPTDVGFSPLGKQMTENVIQQYFLAP